MDKSDLQESLLRLYLRLNGFFTSGFIVHAAQPARNRTEVDTIAVRFAHNREPERRVDPDSWLDLSREHIELAICEAKSVPRFNEALYADIETVKTILRWAGMFSEEDLVELAPQVSAILVPEAKPSATIRRTAPHRNVVVRSLLFCAERPSPRSNQPWFVGSDHIFPFIFSCLSPAKQPRECGRAYGAVQWAELAGLVNFFKKWKGYEPPTYKALANKFLGE